MTATPGFEAALRRGLELLFKHRSDDYWSQYEAQQRAISASDVHQVAVKKQKGKELE